MSLPAANYITDLDPAQPVGSQNISEGDDWFRLLQTVLKNCFAFIAGPVLTSHTELNYVKGVTSAIQPQIDAKASLAQLAAASVSQLALVFETGTAITGVVNTQHVLTNVAASTVTLPATPTVGQRVGVLVANGLATNVVARNGNNLMGLAENMTLNNPNTAITLAYINSTVGWRIV